ncbi:peptidylprolyl isomerase [Burkholderia multivorans]|uniref:peptidylprolyl isomerase n=1 Tax=Burkholderia multivorans TaxID=87883 RepID=UPI00207C1420|nr:peptidylprolyl isomerase [Burkholderia multivorans]
MRLRTGHEAEADRRADRQRANNGLKNDNTDRDGRSNDPHSATAQFFIKRERQRLPEPLVADAARGYAVFGKGRRRPDVVDKIKGVKTGNAGFHQDVPTDDVVIEKAVVV